MNSPTPQALSTPPEKPFGAVKPGIAVKIGSASNPARGTMPAENPSLPAVHPTPRLLVVDDEALQMKALCDTLRDHGFETVGANSAEAALPKLRESRFDLLLTDLTMTGMDGIALLRAAHEIDPDLVGIIMTGQGTITSAVEAMKEGALDYVLKPFKVSVVLPVLSRALTMRRLRLENTALQRRVQERTLQLEAANEYLDAFASSVAHDLHTPARHIATYAYLVLEQHGPELSEQVQKHLNTIAHSGEQMGRLITDLLAFSRLARAELQRRPIQLKALAQKVWDELRAQGELFGTSLNARPIEVTIGDLPTVDGDEALLKQVFVNLLSNALKYTRTRQPARIEIGGQGESPTGTTIFIRDNGVGFDMRYADKLFGMFQRLHSAKEFEGNGVGLANVRRIIQRHGGRVWAEGEVGKGATFHFMLP